MRLRPRATCLEPRVAASLEASFRRPAQRPGEAPGAAECLAQPFISTYHSESARTFAAAPEGAWGVRSTVTDRQTSAEAPTGLLVSLATYNEAGNLDPLIRTIREFAPSAEILVIDDNSPDGTGDLAERLKAELGGIHVIHRAGKLGLGTAILAGMKFAIEHNYEFLLNLDADFSHPPRFIPALLAGMNDHEVMIGSRYIPGGGVEGGFTLKRKLMSSGINGYARLLLGLNTRDNSGAFRCYRVSKLAEIDLDQVRSRGYSFQEEILYWCKRVGCRMGETPILFENRRAGVSKIHMGEAVSALWILLGLGIHRLTAGKPQAKSPA